MEDVSGDEYYQCSNCKTEWICLDGMPEENNMNYCPKCGAKMDGKEMQR